MRAELFNVQKIIVTKESGITTVAQLRNKSIAVQAIADPNEPLAKSLIAVICGYGCARRFAERHFLIPACFVSR